MSTEHFGTAPADLVAEPKPVDASESSTGFLSFSVNEHGDAPFDIGGALQIERLALSDLTDTRDALERRLRDFAESVMSLQFSPGSRASFCLVLEFAGSSLATHGAAYSPASLQRAVQRLVDDLGTHRQVPNRRPGINGAQAHAAIRALGADA